MMWNTYFYDHPINGIAKYKGEYVWFTVSKGEGWADLKDINLLSERERKTIEEDEEENEDGILVKTKIYDPDLYYNLHKLTDEEIKYELSIEEKFLLYRDNNNLNKFWKTEDRTKTYFNNPIIGEFLWYDFENYNGKRIFEKL